MTDTVKRCSKCGQDKPLTEYHRSPGNADGLTGSCRDCRRKQWQTYCRANPEVVCARHRERQREYAAANPEAARAAVRRNQLANERETGRQAQRNGYLWTGPEMELAARSDLTAREVALMTGRTFGAVKGMRHRLRHDPKVITLAGLIDIQVDGGSR
jgi:hypothetical protein